MSGSENLTNEQRIQLLERELKELKKEVDIKFRQYFILLKAEKERISICGKVYLSGANKRYQ